MWTLETLLIAIPKFIQKYQRLKSSAKRAKSKNFLINVYRGKSRLNLKKAILYLSMGLFVLSCLGVLAWQNIIRDLPDPKDLSKKPMRVSTKIYDRNGELLYTIYKDQNRTPIPFDEIPIQVKAATVAYEDAEFYNHPGFSIKGILRSLYKNLRQGNTIGGSTITQQLVKNTLLTPDKTLSRKIKELILSIQVEMYYTKDQILEMYLNEVPYGGTAYGIEEAARTYFNKSARDLTLAESALLAALPQSPTRYSPFGSNPEVAIQRMHTVLERMRKSGFITKEQEEEAKKEKITFSKNKATIKSPHFVFFVRDYLEEKYGRDLVEQGGLSVTTTLDLQIQRLVEEVVASEIKKLKSFNANNAAVLVINPKNGQILAMAGSHNYFDVEDDGQVNVTIKPRQPGSAIKVVNYAYALSHGLTAATLISDTPTIFKTDGQDYIPKNYDDQYRGNISVRSALAESRNIPAVKILASYGVEKMIDMGRKMGITTWKDAKNYGLSLTLGGGEVKLIDLATVYATIANYGNRPKITPIISVVDRNGIVLEEFKCKNSDSPIKAILPIIASGSASELFLDQDIGCNSNRVLDPRVAFILTDILKDQNARSPSFGSNSLLNIKDHPEVAVKTGTSNDLRDNLTVGYTRDFVVAVWVGNNDNSPMSRIASGITGAAPIFNKIMQALLANKAPEEWPIPEGLIQLPICPYTGTLACEGCPLKMEWFIKENAPTKACKKEWFTNPVPTETFSESNEIRLNQILSSDE